MRIMIVSHPRSGSSYLGSVILNALPDHMWKDEPFKDATYENLTDYHDKWNSTIEKLSIENNYIVKIHTHHLHQLKLLGLLDRFLSIQFDKVFGLYRNDLFESTLSLIISNVTNCWHDDTHNISNIQVDFLDFISNLTFVEKTVRQIKENEYGINFDIILKYEDLTYDKVNDGINLGFEYISQDHSIMSIEKFRPKHNVVSNYNELKECASILHKYLRG